MSEKGVQTSKSQGFSHVNGILKVNQIVKK